MPITINGQGQPASSTGPDSVDSASIVDGQVFAVDVANGAITDSKITGPISISKLDTDPLARANHTGTQLLATISDAGSIASADTSDFLATTGGTLTGNLSLVNAGIFQSMGTFGATFINALPSGSSNPTLVIRNNGSLEAGNGVLGTDTKLQRLASNVWGINDGQIRTATNPTDDDDLTRKEYVDDAVGTASTAISDHIADAVGAHAASAISNVPAFSVSATDVQAAIDELATEKLDKSGGAMTGAITMGAGAGIISTGATAGESVFESKVTGDLFDRFRIDADGSMTWDTNNDGSPNIQMFIAGNILDIGSGGKIQQQVGPTANNDLTNKGYVDGEITSAINAIVFGDEYQQEYEATVLSTSSGTYNNFMTLTTPSLPAGTYRVGWRFDYAKSASSCVGQYRLQVDNTTDLDEKLLSSAANNIEVQYSNFDNIVLGAGVHTIDVDARKDSGGGSFSIDEGKIEIWRVA